MGRFRLQHIDAYVLEPPDVKSLKTDKFLKSLKMDRRSMNHNFRRLPGRRTVSPPFYLFIKINLKIYTSNPSLALTILTLKSEVITLFGMLIVEIKIKKNNHKSVS